MKIQNHKLLQANLIKKISLKTKKEKILLTTWMMIMIKIV